MTRKRKFSLGILMALFIAGLVIISFTIPSETYWEGRQLRNISLPDDSKIVDSYNFSNNVLQYCDYEVAIIIETPLEPDELSALVLNDKEVKELFSHSELELKIYGEKYKNYSLYEIKEELLLINILQGIGLDWKSKGHIDPSVFAEGPNWDSAHYSVLNIYEHVYEMTSQLTFNENYHYYLLEGTAQKVYCD